MTRGNVNLKRKEFLMQSYPRLNCYTRRILRGVLPLLNLFGFNPIILITNLRGIPFFIKDLIILKKKIKNNEKTFRITKLYPMLNDRFNDSGTASGHYFHQDLIIARRIFLNNPARHVDIGSRVDGFVAHVASYREIEVFDIRPFHNKIDNIKFIQANLTGDLNIIDYTDSISSLHAIEHFGLGRYGDPIDPYGHIRGLNNIYKLLKNGGKFYFSIPIGKQRIEFNAHRVFSVEYILSLLGRAYKIDRFSYVNDKGDLFDGVPLMDKDIELNYGCNYGCGIFEMTKI